MPRVAPGETPDEHQIAELRALLVFDPRHGSRPSSHRGSPQRKRLRSLKSRDQAPFVGPNRGDTNFANFANFVNFGFPVRGWRIDGAHPPAWTTNTLL